MKNKLLKVLLASVSTSSLLITASISACGFQNYPGNFKAFGKIQLITDVGSIADKSFNQSAWEAIMDATAYDKQNAAIDTSYGYSQPTQASLLVFQKAYKTAIKAGAETLVLPGFHHDLDGKIHDFAKDNKNVNFIGIDIGNPDSQENLYGLTYRTSQSGFLSAINAGIHLNKNPNVLPKSNGAYGLGTYGGLRFGAVTEFMDGWLQGIAWFNTKIKTDQSLPTPEPETAGWNELESVTIGPFDKDTNFSGGFSPGMATSIIEKLIDNNAQVIMGVGNGMDIISVIKKKQSSNVWMIGVDTDQSKIYDPKYVLGSAFKGIKQSTTDVLHYIYNEKNNNRKPSWTGWINYLNNPNGIPATGTDIVGIDGLLGLAQKSTGFIAGQNYVNEYKNFESLKISIAALAAAADITTLKRNCNNGFATSASTSCNLTNLRKVTT